ncbi:hypothetical protein [Sphingomonas psychrotolerans]|uniref:WYL domain-containing protein n=1 Tax=Sphingomonas psychrotolerans TaxID=1327635 RepID=A0A2K8MBX3_9SPHN|nr:hypothetical protein [Sphingomonas psychrotolerans]ATY31347.1 hypothetical protein CVN68_04585 [Sphingomonas psychrotolerans]
MYRSEPDPIPAPTGPLPALFEAIVRNHCVEATYNGGRVVLAPHVAFTRHSEVYVGATTIERDGQPPREEKIGVFKFTGLVDLTVTERSFKPSTLFDPRDERFAAGTLIAVERTAI